MTGVMTLPSAHQVARRWREVRLEILPSAPRETGGALAAFCEELARERTGQEVALWERELQILFSDRFGNLSLNLQEDA